MTVDQDMKEELAREVCKLHGHSCLSLLLSCLTVACPIGTVKTVSGSGVVIGSGGSAINIASAANIPYVAACSGNGVCRTMRDLANGFDGR